MPDYVPNYWNQDLAQVELLVPASTSQNLAMPGYLWSAFHPWESQHFFPRSRRRSQRWQHIPSLPLRQYLVSWSMEGPRFKCLICRESSRALLKARVVDVRSSRQQRRVSKWSPLADINTDSSPDKRHDSHGPRCHQASRATCITRD